MSSETYDWTAVRQWVGRELGVSGWMVVDQERIERFADCTDDRQWIHVDVERARRESPLGTTIAHGFLSLSLLSRFTFEVGLLPPGVTQVLNYGLDRVRFVTPVKAGARVRDHIAILSAEEKRPGRMLVKAQHTLEIEGEEKPALVAETLLMFIARSSRGAP